jgi:prolyl oligopeptidase
MKSLTCSAIVGLAALLLLPALRAAEPVASVGSQQGPPAAPIKPFSETLHGVSVSDPYRYMEAMDSQTVGWLKAQGAFTRKVLDSIPARAPFARRLAAFGASFGVVTSSTANGQPYELYGGRIFYTEREPGSDNLDLFVRDARGTRKLIDVSALRAAQANKPYAINYFQASPDGTLIVVGISAGGSEDASLFAYDATSGKQIAGPVERAQFAGPTWTTDGRMLFMNRLAPLGPGDPASAKYLNSTAVSWDLKSDPRNVIGTAVGNAARLNLTAPQLPFIVTFLDSPLAVFANINGVQNEQEYWLASLSQAADPNAPWRLLVKRDDDVTGIDVHGSDIFLLSHHDAPTFKVLALHAGESFTAAKTLVPAQPDRVIEGIHAASDALYVRARRGIYSRLLRVATGSGAEQEIPLPFEGYITAAFSDPRAAGITLTLESWVVPPTVLRYDPQLGQFTDLKLGVRPEYDRSRFTVRDLQAKARDGVMVPLTLAEPAGTAGPQVVLLDAYGSYGISELPEFSPRIIALLQEGADYAVCHVRGGGELGEAWRLGGKDAQKPNTWRDLIACGEDLIARGTTTKDKLFIVGGSAGGITMGRALTERPDLFAGAIAQVPAANPLRAEFGVSGPANIPEFGSVTTAQGFENLRAMDSYQAVRDGTQYPAVLLTTGLNDPRVAPWEPGKFAARLQASGTRNPVLLRVEAEAGHGIGSTKTQKDAEFADMVAFIFWRAGRAGWQPAAAH